MQDKEKKNIPTSSSRRINRKFCLAGVKLSRRGKLVASLEGGQASTTVKCNFAIFTTKMLTERVILHHVGGPAQQVLTWQLRRPRREGRQRMHSKCSQLIEATSLSPCR